MQKRLETWNAREQKYFDSFRKNLADGIAHYKDLIPNLINESERYREAMRQELLALEQELVELVLPSMVPQ